MVVVLIRMKLAVLRHSTTGRRASEMGLGALLGLALAGATIWLAVHQFRQPVITTDLLAVALAGWALGWALGPVLFGGGEQALRAEHFALLPSRPRQLAVGLAGAALVGLAPAVSLAALTAIVVYGARLGWAPALVGAIAAPLTLIVLILLSRLVAAVFGAALRSLFGAALAALVSATVLALAAAGWALSPAVLLVLYVGLPRGLHATVLALPSGWGLEAVQAASRADWWRAAGLLVALAAACAVLLAAWSRLLARRNTTRPAHGRAAAPRARPATPLRSARRTGPVAAATVKELRTLSRDLLRLHYLFFAVFYGVLLGVIPEIGAGLPVQLPWIGATVVLAAVMTANVYGADGSALWLTLVTPGAESADVRGRQLAWLLVLAPLALVLTVVPIALSGMTWAWPWALALLPAVLGASAGVPVLLSVTNPVVLPEARLRGNNLLAASTNAGQAIGSLLIVALTAAPAAGLVLLGVRYDMPAMRWLGVAVGAATGAASAWWLGELAVRRLRERGPELLAQLRGGPQSSLARRRARSSPDGAAVEDAAVEDAAVEDAQPARPGAGVAAAAALTILCWIPIFPQGLVPMVLKLTGIRDRSWFIALYLPGPLQWPALVAIVAFGAGMLLAAVPIYRRAVPPEHRSRPIGLARLLTWVS